MNETDTKARMQAFVDDLIILGGTEMTQIQEAFNCQLNRLVAKKLDVNTNKSDFVSVEDDVIHNSVSVEIM